MKTKNILLMALLLGGGYLLYKYLAGGNGFTGGSILGGEVTPEIPAIPPPFIPEEIPFTMSTTGQPLNIQGIMPTKTNYGAVKVYPTVTDFLVSKGIKQVYVSRGELMTPKRQMIMQLTQKLTPVIQEPLPAPMQRQYKSLQDLLKGGG